MRISISLVICMFFVITISKAGVKEDKKAIKATIMDYIEGYYNSDGARMKRALHPELAKRIISKGKKGDYLENMSASLLTHVAATNDNSIGINKDKDLKAEIIIYDVFKNVATAKSFSNKYNFIDYIHLGKVNGEWKIINVLWEWIPRGK